MKPLAVGLAVLGTALVPPSATHAHEAATGWTYDVVCCSSQDCRPVSAAEVQATRVGWRIRQTGEVIPYALVRHSRDGDFHRCSVGGLDDTKTICLYAPDMGL
ncbi:hypothetical protein [Chthonobacter rhizosphaerae]|uniref:hypothetical protein n=1 Tax=Chthonobacter rhizosphaerae TaxID=2735553 RepID=UPI0015EE799D|nr:hypothetical protein [Chthonobacter rhizosphaerae]